MKAASSKILLVEDDELLCDTIIDSLGHKYNFIPTELISEAENILQQEEIDLVLLDVMLPDGDGISFLEKIKSTMSVPVIMTTAVSDVPKIVRAIKLGAFDYLSKPVLMEEMDLTIGKALESSLLKKELHLRKELQLATNQEIKLVGNSPSMEKLRKQIQIVGKSDSTVMILGETGTGKELVARQIHASSPRDSGSFVAINCGAIPKDLIESELFGYGKGAFTGAKKSEIGKFKLADGGTLVLDEVGELPVYAQIKLLRVLEEREFYPVGSNKLEKVNVRVLASTNQNLKEMMEQKLFREDLYYRLNVCNITIPPLRERGDDILELAYYFMDQFNRKLRKNFQSISPEAERILKANYWKGNIRELRNTMENIVLFEEGLIIEAEHIQPRCPDCVIPPPPSQQEESVEQKIELDSPKSLDEEIKSYEKKIILQALQKTNGNKTKAAKILKISPPALYYRLEKYEIAEKSET